MAILRNIYGLFNAVNCQFLGGIMFLVLLMISVSCLFATAISSLATSVPSIRVDVAPPDDDDSVSFTACCFDRSKAQHIGFDLF